MTITHRSGFTLLELVVTVIIIGVLATIAFVAFDPGSRFADARNSIRTTDINEILSALKVYQVEHGGQFPSELSDLGAGSYEIGTNGMGNCVAPSLPSCTNGPALPAISDCVDLTELVADGYIPDIPVDPNDDDAAGDTDAETGYFVTLESNGILRIGACEAENGETIIVSR